MTTVEIATRLIAKSKVTSLAKATMEELICISDAVNHAVQEYFATVPEVYRTTTMSSTHAVATTLTANFTNGDNSVSGSPFTDAQRGDSVSIAGDELTYNEITGNGTLLNDYRGTTGSKLATVYDDAIALTDFSIERMVSDPRLLDIDRKLTQAKQFWTRSGYRHDRVGEGRGTSDYPSYYWLDNVGGSAVTDALAVIRLDPIPTKAFTLNFNVVVRPVAYTWKNMMNTPLALPVDDTLMYSTVLPMVMAHLAGTDLWDGSKGSASAAMASGNKALERAEALPSEIEKPSRRVFTRPNF